MPIGDRIPPGCSMFHMGAPIRIAQARHGHDNFLLS